MRQLVLKRATAEDVEVVRGLLEAASLWLKTKGTDQWQAPWPSVDGRNKRISRAIEAGRTWLVWDGARPVATATVSPNHHGIWPPEAGHEPAVYVRRNAVSREYSGRGLGGQLLDWAGLRARREYGACWIRVDVWTTNTKLHEYYRSQGFSYCGCSPIADYPSAALFQKPTGQIMPAQVPLLREGQGKAKAPE